MYQYFVLIPLPNSGQTGSGKTFTMLGPAENAENLQHDLRGVIPRSFEYIFHLIKKEQELVSLNFKGSCVLFWVYFLKNSYAHQRPKAWNREWLPIQLVNLSLLLDIRFSRNWQAV